MSEEKPDKSYGLDPVETEKPGPAAGGDAADTPPEQIDEVESDRPGPPETDGAPDEPSHIKGLDICPNCGSPLGGVDAVVCLRCGYDMKTLKVIKVETGKTTTPEEDEPEPAEPLCAPGVGGVVVPAAMAGVSLLLLALGYLFGARGLFGGAADEAIGFGTRIGGLLGMLVRTGGLAVAGLGGLSVLTHMVDRPFGDIRLAAIRMLGIFAALGLLTFFNIESSNMEGALEVIFCAVIFVGLVSVFFRLTMRDAATLMGVTAFSVIILLLLSWLALWTAGVLGGPSASE